MIAGLGSQREACGGVQAAKVSIRPELKQEKEDGDVGGYSGVAGPRTGKRGCLA